MEKEVLISKREELEKKIEQTKHFDNKSAESISIDCAISLINRGYLLKGKKILNELVYKYNYMPAMIELGLIERKTDIRKAINLFRRALIKTDDAWVIYTLASMYLEIGDYENFGKIIFKYEQELSYEYKEKYMSCLLYAYQKLSVFSKNINMKVWTYSHKQIISYDEKTTINHILKHKNDLNSNFYKTSYKKNNLKRLLYTVENKIDVMKPTYNGFNSEYYVHYPNIGKNGEDYLKVITLFDTKNILTMFPIKTNESIKIDAKKVKIKKRSF